MFFGNIFITRRIIKPIVFSIISDDLARVRKINIDYYNLLYLLMVAVIVAWELSSSVLF